MSRLCKLQSLPARQLDSPRVDERIQAVLQRANVLVEHRQAQRSREVHLRLRQPHQDVVAQRFAEHQRCLGGVRGVRRQEERGRVRHQLAVPGDLARVTGQQAKQHAQQRGLARANATRDHGEGALAPGSD
jgi:hypothetical protein